MKAAKKIYVENTKMFDEMFKIETSVTGKTLSFLIEDHVISSVLKTKWSRHYAKIMISAGLNKALASLLESVSQKVAGDPTYGNTKELLVFASSLYAEC